MRPPAVAALPGRRLRFLDGLAGLVAAGMLVLGVLLAVAALTAPAVLSRVGLGPATGPGWVAVALHLLVGGTGEVVIRLRRNWGPRARLAADLSVILVAMVVIWWAWWR
jgi:hypothetical protein